MDSRISHSCSHFGKILVTLGVTLVHFLFPLSYCLIIPNPIPSEWLDFNSLEDEEEQEMVEVTWEASFVCVLHFGRLLDCFLFVKVDQEFGKDF